MLYRIFTPTIDKEPNKITCILRYKLFYLVGLARFELAHARVKVWCLTAWLQPNINILYIITLLLYNKKIIKAIKNLWGGMWDSNPRSPVPQTGALTNYATSTITLRLHAYIIVQQNIVICQQLFFIF